MTPNELYKKQLYNKAKEKRREIERETERLLNDPALKMCPEPEKAYKRAQIEVYANKRIELAELEILEPILVGRTLLRLMELRREQKVLEEARAIIEPLEIAFLQKKKLSLEQRCQIARITQNKSTIKKLTCDNSVKVLDALLSNPCLDYATIRHIHDRKKGKIVSNNTCQSIRKVPKKISGCLITILTVFFLFGLICYWVN